jgi:hypothetical protein
VSSFGNLWLRHLSTLNYLSRRNHAKEDQPSIVHGSSRLLEDAVCIDSTIKKTATVPVRLGRLSFSRAEAKCLERDPRCMMITLDPETAEKSRAILKEVAQAHSGMAGVYGAVLVEGTLRKGDPVELLN